MKHTLLSIFLFCTASININAQSLIVTTEGNPITGYEVEVSSSGVFYKASDSADSPFIKLNKSNVLVIRNADGSVVNLSESTATSSAYTIQNSVAANEKSAQKEMNPDDYLDYKYNRDMIARYNTPAEMVFEKEKYKTKNATKVAFQHYATNDSQFASKDLIVRYNIALESNSNPKAPLVWDGDKYYSLRKVFVELENRSNKTIYVDLANTFLIRNGESQPYYVPSAVTSISGGSTGASVNLGGVARTAGVGGAVGALASAVNVGGSKSNYSSNTIYSQRVIAIPPYSTTKLDGINYVSKNTKNRGVITYNLAYRTLVYRAYATNENAPEKVGEITEWNESNTPNKISNFLTYSFSENFEEFYTLNSTIFVSRAINVRNQTGSFLISEPRLNCEIENLVIFLRR